MTLQLFDNLLKAQKSPTTRTISQQSTLGVKIPGTEKGYLQGAIYQDDMPQVVRWDGLAGNLNDPKDGVIWLPLGHPVGNSWIPLAKGTYFLKVEACDTLGGIPQFWNINFDII